MGRQPAGATIVTDISYGDAGKGTIVDYLVRQAGPSVVVRHNGGPQAAHNVVATDGCHHTFAQFGSGSLVPGTQTYLSEYMLVNPINMFPEAGHLQALGVRDIWQRVSVDRQALVILPWQQCANQLRELARGNDRHGSCGLGIGEATVDHLEGVTTIRVADLADTKRLPQLLADARDAKFRQLKDELGGRVPFSEQSEQAWAAFTSPDLVGWLVEQYRLWTRLVRVADRSYLEQIARTNRLVFEGAQGVLLDEWHGFYPYNTWSRTTHANAERLLADIGYEAPVSRLGVMRGYMTRHGAGPLVTEDLSMTSRLPDYHNGFNAWQQDFRVGPLDLVAHRYALRVAAGTDQLAVTNLDRLQALPDQAGWQICDRYRYTGSDPDASDYLEFDGQGLVCDITPIPPGDWHNPPVRLAQLLADCQPVYQAINPSPNAAMLLEAIENRLNLPITLTSHGPTAADKRVR